MKQQLLNFPSQQSLATTVLLSVSMNLSIFIPHVSGILQYLTCCVWLLSLSTLFSRFIHVSEFHSFQRLYNIPLCVYTTFCLSIHLLMNICAFIFRLLLKCWYEHLCRSICLNICFNSFGCISMRRIAGSYGNSIFNFWETVKLLTTVDESFYIPMSNVYGF